MRREIVLLPEPLSADEAEAAGVGDGEADVADGVDGSGESFCEIADGKKLPLPLWEGAGGRGPRALG